MDGIASFHCPLCKCKTTVDFTSHLVEKDATIASLTAMLEKSVTLDVWRMTVQEFEKKIASLTAERDALRAKVTELEQDAHLNAAMLARQTDMAREAENRLAVRLRGECDCPGGSCGHLPCDPWVARALNAESQLTAERDAALATIAELREELALAQNALAQAH